MKRLLIGLSIIICLSFICIYIFIPEKLTISKITLVDCNPDATTRTLIHTNNWQRWLTSDGHLNASEIANTGNSFIYNSDTFTINKRLHNALDIAINTKNEKINSMLNILPIGRDSVALQWQSEITSGMNPVVKLQRYQQAIDVKQKMAGILNGLSTFLKKNENVYGLHIQKTSTTDTFLIATKAVFTHYPATPDIYHLVKVLQTYISKKGAQQTNAPMLNVTKVDNAAYQVMVALPTNIKLADEGNIFFRRMVPGNFLISEVKGGDYTINQGIESMHLYITDYRNTSMAIPFQSLVTDRSKEPDTSRWITRIYYPIKY